VLGEGRVATLVGSAKDKIGKRSLSLPTLRFPSLPSFRQGLPPAR